MTTQRQFVTVDFSKKGNSSVNFTYKHGEIDNNGVEARLLNVDIENATGIVYLRDPDGVNLEPRLVTMRGEFADFTVTAEKVGQYRFEIVIFNNNGITKSGIFIYEVIPSLRPSNMY